MELKNGLTLPFLSLLSNYVHYAFFLIQVLAVRSGVQEQLDQTIFYILVLGLPVQSNLILTKPPGSGCSISWIGAIS